jgi:hypothetical protein
MHTQPQETQKITAHIPKYLLQNAQEATRKGITETIKIGLEKVAIQQACRDLLDMAGKCRIDIDLEDLRRDKY